MLSVRLDPETRKLLNRLARERRTSRSEIVRQGIRLVANQGEMPAVVRPYDLIRHLVGSVDGLPADLSERTGEKFYELLKRQRR
jgi:Arc/MetJ-type ribon-helix-helix transcriptional regulator